MKKNQFDELKNSETTKDSVISVNDLSCDKDRTLIYGYTCERETFHVYIKNKEIHVVIYKTDYEQNKAKNMREMSVTSNWSYVPDKRLYPERCDYDFCQLLIRKNISLPFTSWDEQEKSFVTEGFYGYIL